MKLTAMQCSICGEEVAYEIVEIELVSRERLGQPGWYCWTCNVGHHTAQDLFLADHHAEAEDDERS